MMSPMRLATTWRAWLDSTRESFSRSSREISILWTSALYFSMFRSSGGAAIYQSPLEQPDDFFLFLRLGREAACGSGHLADYAGNGRIAHDEGSCAALHFAQ